MFFKSSIGGRLSFIQGFIIAITLIVSMLFLFNFLSKSAEKKEIGFLSKEVGYVKKLLNTECKNLNNMVESYFNIFKANFKEIKLDNTKSIKVKGIDTPILRDGEEVLNLNFEKIDKLSKLISSTATVFVKKSEEFIRVATSVKKEDGSRAVGTLLDKNSNAYKKLINKEKYIGKAKLFGVDYMTVYEPLVDENQNIIGALYIGYDMTKEINLLKDAIKEIKMGESGYVYVLGTKDDNRGRLLVHPSIEGKDIYNTPDANGEMFVQTIVNQKKGTIFYDWKNNGESEAREKVAVFDYCEALDWVIVGGSYKDEFLKSTKEAIEYLTIGGIIFIILIVILIYLAILINVINPIKNLEARARDLASGDGDLTKRLAINGSDEIAKASNSINKFIEKVQSTMLVIKDSSCENASIANELASSAVQIGQRVEHEAKIVTETVKSSEDMKFLLDNSIAKAENTQRDILNANANLGDAREKILSMVHQIQHSSEVEAELASKLNQLSSDAEQVKGVLTVIGDIADQTNLLALNAAIEAARAGEHGRGFAVVADEVRQLAERTQKSLTEINSTISIIVQSIIDASEQMNRNSTTIQELSNTSSEVEHKIDETSTVMSSSAKVAEESLIDTQKIVDSFQEKIKKLEEINELSTTNARSVEEMVSAIENSHKMIEELNVKLNEFKS